MTTSPDKVLLDIMRSMTPIATLTDCMYIDGKVVRRCGICRCRPVSPDAYHVLWCDEDIDEFLEQDKDESMDDFIARKRTVPQGYGRD